MADHKIAIITDSTCDLSPDLYTKYDIKMVPLYILWGGKQYLDRIDINPDDFYLRLRNDPIKPKTSQPTPQDFLFAYRQCAQKGAEQAVVLPLSDALSGTYSSAKQAAEQSDIPVSLADTRATTMSLGWQVLAAARVRDAGGNVNDILNAADEVRRKEVLLIILDTLEFLSSGGRLGNASKYISSILNIKPHVRLNHETGKVELGELSRTRSRAIETMYNTFFRKIGSTGKKHIAVLHNASLQQGEMLLSRIKDEYNPDELILADGSPVIGVHSGPNALALSGYCGD